MTPENLNATMPAAAQLIVHALLRRSAHPDLAEAATLQRWQERVGAYTSDLATCLRIPFAGTQVTIELVDDAAIPSFAPFQLSINGQPARVCARPAEASEESLCREVYRNRELLITPQLVESLIAELWPAGAPGGAVPKLTALLQRFCARNISIGALALHAPNGIDVLSEAVLFEAHRDDDVKITVELGSRLYRDLIKPDGEMQVAAIAITHINVQRTIFHAYGVVIPLLDFEPSLHLAANEYQIRINNVNLPAERMDEPRMSDVETQIMEAVDESVLAFFTMESLERSLDILRLEMPALVDCVVERIGFTVLYDVLASLIEEAVSIQNLPRILDAIVSTNRKVEVDSGRFIAFTPNTDIVVLATPGSDGTRVKDADDYARAVRTHLKSQMTERHAKTDFVADSDGFGIVRASRQLTVYLLEPDAEKRLAASDKQPLSQSERDNFIGSIWHETSGVGVVLTYDAVRKPLWRLAGRELPELVILAYNELSPDSNITPVARIYVM